MPYHDVSRPGGFFERSVYALTTAGIVFACTRVWGGPTHEASVLAAELWLASWFLTMGGLTVLRRLGHLDRGPAGADRPDAGVGLDTETDAADDGESGPRIWPGPDDDLHDDGGTRP